jgi:RND family efflux transporter MFP subunit
LFTRANPKNAPFKFKDTLMLEDAHQSAAAPTALSESSEVRVTAVSTRRLKFAGVAGGVILLLVIAGGAASRQANHHELASISDGAQIPTVSVVQPTGDDAGALILPGRLQAWSEAPVYARTNGYLRHWYADIGDHVHPGQILADIDTPEVDQQLVGATAALATADAQRALAATTSQRWDRLVAENAVSKQEADQRRGDLAARQAMQNEAAANVSRLHALTDFKRIVAPFAGVVTSRSTDVGALIVAGDARATPLFTVSDTSRLRLYVSVPQSFASTIQPGMKADFKVPDHPNQVFTADVVRTAGAVDAQSGAMLIQLVYDNSAGFLKPGAYAQVDLKLPQVVTKAAVVRIPSSALLFRKEGTAVAVVDGQGRVTIRPIQISQDFGGELAIGAGLTQTDRVVDSPSDDISTGDRVKPVPANGVANAHA